ncbi:polysaccharide biosynthesis/export family protein [Polaribacter sejongensis]|uniref:polysaccharide biosynthesis/export family protein n=1 Tax=Polaribacter sejongensis TaxID=985043 RepID=UPI0035A6966B
MQKKKLKELIIFLTSYRVDDILNIDIKSNDETLVSVFKKQSSNSNNTNIDESQIFFNGYSIDSYGNIRMPTLGEINVLGYTELEVRKK